MKMAKPSTQDKEAAEDLLPLMQLIDEFGGPARIPNRVISVMTQLLLDAKRYRWLRARDLDTIAAGGVFAGMTPDNVVLNGEDLDAAVDAALAAQQQSEASMTTQQICTFCGAHGHTAEECGWRDSRTDGELLLIRRDTLQALYDAALMDDEHGPDSIWELPEMAAARAALSRPGLPRAIVDSLLPSFFTE